jgi:hypothetical protein
MIGCVNRKSHIRKLIVLAGYDGHSSLCGSMDLKDTVHCDPSARPPHSSNFNKNTRFTNTPAKALVEVNSVVQHLAIEWMKSFWMIGKLQTNQGCPHQIV